MHECARPSNASLPNMTSSWSKPPLEGRYRTRPSWARSWDRAWWRSTPAAAAGERPQCAPLGPRTCRRPGAWGCARSRLNWGPGGVRRVPRRGAHDPDGRSGVGSITTANQRHGLADRVGIVRSSKRPVEEGCRRIGDPLEVTLGTASPPGTGSTRTSSCRVGLGVPCVPRGCAARGYQIRLGGVDLGDDRRRDAGAQRPVPLILPTARSRHRPGDGPSCDVGIEATWALRFVLLPPVHARSAIMDAIASERQRGELPLRGASTIPAAGVRSRTDGLSLVPEARALFARISRHCGHDSLPMRIVAAHGDFANRAMGLTTPSSWTTTPSAVRSASTWRCTTRPSSTTFLSGSSTRRLRSTGVPPSG